MGLISQISLLARGRARRSIQGIVDANGLELIEQGILEAEQTLIYSKHELASVITERKRLEHSVDELEQQVSRREIDGREALARDLEALALQIADDLTSRQARLTRTEAALSKVRHQEAAAKDAIKSMAADLERYRGEFATAKTLAGALRAQQRTACGVASSSRTVDDLEAVLSRVSVLQQSHAEHAAAMQSIDAEISGDDLEAKLESEGIGGRQNSVQSVIDKWREENASA
ncbi:MAG: PspA/IM30 family protein [Pseudomonadota bacterium]